MKILVTGGNGLVGSHFVENYQQNLKENDILLSPKSKELDITNQKSVKDFFKLHNPNIIIHFAAFTDVSLAEKERGNRKGPCWTVNLEGTANLIRATGDKSYFIHISTDVVFAGKKENPGPYPEDYPTEDNPNFLSWYGWTKREAEKLVMQHFANYVILRIANPVRVKYKDKLDYVQKILKQFDTNKLYPFFDDQYLTLTYVNEVTETLRILLKERLSGIYHVSSYNIFTPYKMAKLLIAKARGKKNIIKPISVEDFLKSNPSRYPQYGGLKVEKTQNILNLRFMKWEEIIFSIVKQLSV